MSHGMKTTKVRWIEYDDRGQKEGQREREPGDPSIDIANEIGAMLQ